MEKEEVTVWTYVSDVEANGNVLNSIEGLDNHPDARFGLDDNVIGFKTIREEMGVSLDDADTIDQIMDEIRSAKSTSIFGVKTEDSLINLKLNGDFQEITKDESGKLKLEHITHEQGKFHIGRLIGKLHKEMIELSPALKREKVIKEARNSEKVRRQQRIKNVPEMPCDFWQAIHALADYSDNFQEFKLLLQPAMDDISDRNLTRLGRASEILDDDVDVYSEHDIDVCVYRCLPSGEEIEAGDWVSTDYNYALSHASNVPGKYEVVEAILPANEIICGADTCEAYYAPREIWDGHEDLVSVWKSVTHRKRMNYEPMEKIINRALKKEGLSPIESEKTLA